jgi:uncharacterized membrane protein
VQGLAGVNRRLWDGGTLTDLYPNTDQETRARSINDAGAVLAAIYNTPGPGTVVYQDGVVRPGQADTWAINELDHEVGTEFLCRDACSPLVPDDFGFFPTGLALNNRDQVTGRMPVGGGWESAFYWVPELFYGTLTDLGGAPRGEGLSINEHGAAVGRRFDANFNYQPFLYENGTLTELGTATAGAVGGIAAGINDRGDIAGSDYDTGRMPIAGWVGRPGNLRSLQDLLVDGSCFFMIEVVGFNNRGQILARGWECNVGSPIPFLFEPVKVAR